MKTDKAIIRIRSFISKKRWSKLKFANESSLPESTIRRLFKDNFDPRLSTLRKMEAVIPSDFLPMDVSQREEAQ